VSELVVFIFSDRYRAPEVLNELRRRNGLWSQDVDRAIAVTLDAESKASVHMSIDLSKREGVGWARVWGALMKSALFVPITDGMVEAVDQVACPSAQVGCSLIVAGDECVEIKWWRDVFETSDNFRRDVSSLINPSSSAILIMLTMPNISSALDQLRNYCSTIIHTTISSALDETLQGMLNGPVDSGIKTLINQNSIC